MKLTKPIRGVAAGEIYPREFKAGEECPPELLAAAQSLGAVEIGDAKRETGRRPGPRVAAERE